MAYEFDTDPEGGTYTIVIATDLSPASSPALAESLRLASAVRDPVLHFVHAEPAGTPKEKLAAIKEVMTRELVDQAAELGLPVPKNRLIHVGAGAPKDVVLSLAHDANADLLVLGTRFASPAEREGHVSVSDDILHAAPCSVLVVNGRRAQRRGA